MKRILSSATAILLLLLCLSACSIIGLRENRSTDTRSTDFKNFDEKIAFLKEYIQDPTEILDAEYHIMYWDNSSGLLPAPSDWDMTMAIKLNPQDIPQWLDGMHEVTKKEIDMSWWDELYPTLDSWNLGEPSAYYERDDSFSYLVLYRESNVILKSFTS